MSKLSGNKFSTIVNIFPSNSVGHKSHILAHKPTMSPIFIRFGQHYCSKGRNLFCYIKYSSLLCLSQTAATAQYYNLE